MWVILYPHLFGHLCLKALIFLLKTIFYFHLGKFQLVNSSGKFQENVITASNKFI